MEDVEDNRMKALLKGTVGAKTAELTCQGKTKVVSVPPGREYSRVDCRWRRLWNLFERNWKSLDSFYQNFYEPLFGKEATQTARPSQAEQTRDKVKQSLGAVH